MSGESSFYQATTYGTYTRYQDGQSVYWSPTYPPSTATVGLYIKLSGFGKAVISFDYNIAGTSKSFSGIGKVGDWGIRKKGTPPFVTYEKYWDPVSKRKLGLQGESISWDYTTPGTYRWSASNGSYTLIGQEWNQSVTTTVTGGGTETSITGGWVDESTAGQDNQTNISGSGEWIVKDSYVCRICKQTGLTSLTEHYVNPCPNTGCQEGGSYWNCYGVPSSHALLATCSNCNATNVYACSGHPDACTSGSSSSSDLTPNCPDCTSHCSSPCSCTNSGTCDGTASTPSTPTYHACGDHETSVIGSHSYGTYTCGSHSGYACQESNDHKTYISSCTSTNSDGNTCNNSSGYYECSQHSHTYPPSIVACGGASYTGCSGASSRTAHHVESCSSGCGNGYWTCSPTAVYNHEMPFTCRRCGTSFTRCSNGTCTTATGTYTYHWAQ